MDTLSDVPHTIRSSDYEIQIPNDYLLRNCLLKASPVNYGWPLRLKGWGYPNADAENRAENSDYEVQIANKLLATHWSLRESPTLRRFRTALDRAYGGHSRAMPQYKF
jgi:hypothetical protein